MRAQRDADQAHGRYVILGEAKNLFPKRSLASLGMTD
jgi:hypothetical protein